MSKKVILIGLIMAVIIGGIYIYVTTVVFPSPKNCIICHFIAPYYEQWETSSHSKVPCLKCHEYSPTSAVVGEFMLLAGKYNARPLTNVPDKNCLQSGCHDKRLLDSKVLYTKRGIIFDHKTHFSELKREITLHCRSCHSDIVQGSHIRVSMDVCFLCHFKEVSHDQAFTRCPSCHSAPKQPIVVMGKTFSHDDALKAGYKCNQCHTEVTRGDVMTPKEKCYFCHVERQKIMYVLVGFVHEKHVTEKQIDCLWCHPRIEHEKISMAEKIPLLGTRRGKVPDKVKPPEKM